MTAKTSQDVVSTDLQHICHEARDAFTAMSGKRLLVTGGAGFLGYYLVQSVVYWNKQAEANQRIQLTVYDNYIRGIPLWLKKLEGTADLTLTVHDITHPLPEEIEDFHYIIHAASIASPTYYRKHPIETMDANVNGVRFLLEYAKRQKQDGKPIDGFLFFSSSEIYGNPTPESIPTPETYYGYVSCNGPRACYDESKRYGETLCVNFARQYGLPVKIARPFNNYGPGLKITDRRVLPDFSRDILAGRDIVMLSDGSPTRTFCYVADAIVGYLKVLVKGQTGEAYNIGVEAPEISMADIARKMARLGKELFGYHGNVLCQSSPDSEYLTDNPNRRCPDIAKARRELKYAPGISLDDGLMRSLIWYRDHAEGDDA